MIKTLKKDDWPIKEHVFGGVGWKPENMEKTQANTGSGNDTCCTTMSPTKATEI